MQARIIIKRKFIKGKKREIIALLRELRSGALQQPGYISGETLLSRKTRKHRWLLAPGGTWRAGLLGKKMIPEKPWKKCWRPIRKHQANTLN